MLIMCLLQPQNISKKLAFKFLTKLVHFLHPFFSYYINLLNAYFFMTSMNHHTISWIFLLVINLLPTILVFQTMFAKPIFFLTLSSMCFKLFTIIILLPPFFDVSQHLFFARFWICWILKCWTPNFVFVGSIFC